jgi:hypothetical protein
MIDVSEIEMYRDGGTIEFRVRGSDADGFYRLQTPFRGVPEPLFCNEVKLAFGSGEEGRVLAALDSWLKETITTADSAAVDELVATHLWLNLPDRLRKVVPFARIRRVVDKLRQRQS